MRGAIHAASHPEKLRAVKEHGTIDRTAITSSAPCCCSQPPQQEDRFCCSHRIGTCCAASCPCSGLLTEPLHDVLLLPLAPYCCLVGCPSSAGCCSRFCMCVRKSIKSLKPGAMIAGCTVVQGRVWRQWRTETWEVVESTAIIGSIKEGMYQ